jgi:hypothetical protein
MPSCASAVQHDLTQQKVSLSQCNKTHQSGMHYLRDASSKGHIVQGIQNPGDTKSQTDHPGTHCLGRQHPVITQSLCVASVGVVFCADLSICQFVNDAEWDDAITLQNQASAEKIILKKSPKVPCVIVPNT